MKRRIACLITAISLLIVSAFSCTNDMSKSSSRKVHPAHVADTTDVTATSETNRSGRGTLTAVPVFQNELANKLVGRLHAIQLAKAETGASKDLHREEEIVLREIESIRSLLVGEEQLIMNQYLAETGLYDGHHH